MDSYKTKPLEVKKENILQLEKLSIGYKSGRTEKILVNDINYSAGSGKIIALMGINGSGKSTLLKTITGWLSPIAGKCFIQSSDTSTIDVKEMAKLAGIVSPQVDIPTSVDVYSLIALGRIPYTGIPGTLSEKDHEIINEVIELTGIKNYSSREVNSLSDGERQRVLIARALVQETPLVIMDEPTAFLDIVQRKKIMQMIRTLAEKTNRTFLVSTHESQLALEYADEFLFIHNHSLLATKDKNAAQKYLEEVFSANE